MPPTDVLLLAVLNWAAFLAFGLDKRHARLRRRRIPEARLIALGFACGGLGGWLGVLAFRHKTRKLGFLAPFLLATASGAAAWIWWFTR